MPAQPASPDHNAALGARVEDLARARILCVGDLMLDRFIYGTVERVSPEAPIPVFSIREETTMLGGAGNVVRNIRSLGGTACFLSVVGDDKTGTELMRMIGGEARVQPYVLVERGRASTRKTRYIAANQQLLRADRETKETIKHSTEEQLIGILNEEVQEHDVVVLSDYGKGVLTPALVTAAIETARKAGKPVIVDPKSRDFGLYSGAFLLSPNLHELSIAAGRELNSDEDIIIAAGELMKKHRIENLLVTRSKEGMTLVTAKEAHHIPVRAREIYDVSGAGDTAIATLATAYAAGASLLEAATLANLAAGIVVGKLGTAVVYRTDLKTALYTQDTVASQSKILPFEVASDQVSIWKREGKRVGFTNGCFDLVHPGHLALLQEAKSHCDRLVVGLNSDASVKRLKGDGRPVNSEMERAMLLAALSVVDMVVIFRDDTPMALIEAFRPDVLIKGGDYKKDEVVGGEFVESCGGKVVLCALKEGYSTTNLIARIG